MLRDNLHETTYANEIFGEAIAREGIAPMITQVVGLHHPWIPIHTTSYRSGITGDISFRVLPSDPATVQIRGSANSVTGVTQGQTLWDLPEHIMSSADRKGAIFGSASSTVYTGFGQAGADRQAKAFGVSGATSVSFDGFAYAI